MHRNTLLFIIFFLQLPFATPAPGDRTLQGPAFSDPTFVVPMPKSWIEAPITRTVEARGATVAMVMEQHLHYGLLPLIQAYAKPRGLNVAVTEGTCGLAMGLLNRKAVDVGGFCCPPTAADRLPGLRYHTVGITPLAILVHPDNPVDSLILEEVQGLFDGRITNWSRVKAAAGTGFSLPVKPIARLHCKTRPGHWRLILDEENLFSPQLTEVGTIPDMVATVAKHPGAIGYEETWIAVDKNRSQGPIKTVRVNGFSDTDGEALARGDFPFYHVQNITSWTGPGPASQEATQLVQHLLDNAGRVAPEFHMVPHRLLRRAGWRFEYDELVGPP
ncbi:MAG: substrate-binding domain-containing protein [Magnetococcales bacterium]|nr:substrate-binding domain-containing protein [Magnetococcales bacterium]